MEMIDSVKRKEPEPETKMVEEKKEDAKPPVSEQPDAKRPKTSSPDVATVRKQIEYYLSDDNLKFDQFFHVKVSENSDGWLDVNLVLSCNKMKAMRATKEDVLAALKDSKIEINDDNQRIRRPGNLPLPSLEKRPEKHQKKGAEKAHDGGVVCVVKGVPEEQSWMQIKASLKEKLPDKVALWFVSEVSDQKTCIIACAPFENDVKFFEQLQLKVGATTLKVEVGHGDSLQQALKVLPKYIKEKRDKEARKKQKERNRPIVVGQQRFVNAGALRNRVKEILNSRSDGEALKPEGSDYKLIKSVLSFHPKGAEKSEGMVGIKVAKSVQGDSRCFYMVKEDGKEEDFSAMKCLSAIEANPPFVEVENKEPKKKEAEGSDAPKQEQKKDETKEKAKPVETPAAEEKVEEKKEEAKPVEILAVEEKVEKKTEEEKKGLSGVSN